MKKVLLTFTFIMIAALTLMIFVKKPVAYPDVIYYQGSTYYSSKGISGNQLTTVNLGDKLGFIQYKVGKMVTNPNYSPRELDASKLNIGTPIFSLSDYPINFRIAVIHQEKIVVYQKMYPIPWERLVNKLQSLGIYSYDGINLITAIEDQPVIATLLNVIIDNQGINFNDRSSSHAKPIDPEQVYLVRFNLLDGTAFSLVYNIEQNEIYGIALPNDILAQAINKALN